jgi:hypothetical protein
VALGPQEIQVGILKRLRGTPIVRHDVEWQMVYSPLPPYEILQNKQIDFPTMQRLRRFARFWDLVGNSGHFVETTPLLWAEDGRPFESFLRFSDWLFERVGRQHSIALPRLEELLFCYLVENLRRDTQPVARVMWRDHQRCGKSDVPPFLRPHLVLPLSASQTTGRRKNAMVARQTRHASQSEAAAL